MDNIIRNYFKLSTTVIFLYYISISNGFHSETITKIELNKTADNSNITIMNTTDPVPAQINITFNEIPMYLETYKNEYSKTYNETNTDIKKEWSKLLQIYNSKYEYKSTLPDIDGESRTFGRIKKLQQMLIPVAFKFGIMFTLIIALVGLVIKSILISKAILFLNFIGILLKLASFKFGKHGDHHYSYVPHQPISHHDDWSTLKQKQIHLHIHNPGHNDHHYGEHVGHSYVPIAKNDHVIASYNPYHSSYNVNHKTYEYE